MVRASDYIRSSAIGRLTRRLQGEVVRLAGAIARASGGAIIVRLFGRLCSRMKRVAHGSVVLSWTDRVVTWKTPQRASQINEYQPRILKRFVASPLFRRVAQWLAAMVPALILLTGDQERAAVVLIALIGTAWAASRHKKSDTALEDKAFGKAYGSWLVLLLLGSAFSAVFGSGDIQLAIWYEWIFWWIAVWLAYQSGRFIVRTHHFGTVLAGLGIVFGTLAVFQKIAGYGDVAGWVPLALRPIVGARATGFFGNPNVFAAAVNLLIWPLAALLIESAVGRAPLDRPVARQTAKRDVNQVVQFQIIIYGIALTGLMLALLLTRSRAAWLGAVGAVAIMIPQMPFFHKIKTRPGFWVATGALVLLIIMILIPNGTERTTLALIQNQNVAWQGRLIIWKEAISLFLHSPLLGGGPGSLSSITLPGGAQALHSHNILLQWLAETGLFQTLIMLLFICWYFMQALKRVQTWRSGSSINHRSHGQSSSSSALHPHAHTHSLLLPGFTAAIAAILIHGIFDYPLAARPIGLLWWVWIGFGLSLAAEN